MKAQVLDYLEKGILVSPELEELELKQQKTESKKEPTQLPVTNQPQGRVEIKQSHTESNSKKSLKDFITLYNTRYTLLQSLLRQRQELQNIMSINKILVAQENETVSCIAMILDISLTRNNNYIITLEDKTGIVKAIITKKNKEIFTIAKDLTPDEVIGVLGTKGTGVIFVNTILNPDVPLSKELKKSPEEGAAVFIGDVHVGSTFFLEESFKRFLAWIKGEHPDREQQRVVKKIKYLFITGDLVEGIGVFPGQEKELKIKDLYEQYNVFCKYIKQIPQHINIILCPGNHDSVRIAEPQPNIPENVVEELVEQNNVFFVSSPALVNIGATTSFSGFDVLLYHGFSFPYYATNIESLRLTGGLESVENTKAYLLKKRHLAPTHGSTRYQLGFEEDPLVIKTVPDFFVSGHIHRAAIKSYRNVT